MLFHVSQEPDIGRFDPRPAENFCEPVVWAIDAEHLRNYLLPRDCPRVTYYAGPESDPADVERFVGPGAATVIAVESGWLDRIRSCRLSCYLLPPETFECVDECAGYFISRMPVEPAGVEFVDDVMREMLRRGVELRFVRNLWHLHDAVAASSLRFSMIRMRNAEPPLRSP